MTSNEIKSALLNGEVLLVMEAFSNVRMPTAYWCNGNKVFYLNLKLSEEVSNIRESIRSFDNIIKGLEEPICKTKIMTNVPIFIQQMLSEIVLESI